MTKVKMFSVPVQLGPLPIPDLSSMEEQVNMFMSTMEDKDIISVELSATSTGRNEIIFYVSVVYRVA